jgi:hypothetical protein
MHTSKMVLVPSGMVNKETGVENLMSSLDKEMRTILDDKNLPSDAKLVQYSQILHRYQKTGEERKQPFKIEVQEPVKQKLPSNEEILKNIPAKHTKQASSLLEFVKNNPKIQWSDENELIVDGVKFEGSHIVDLIDDFSRARSTQQPVRGAEAFARVLAKSNVPKSCIANKYRHDLFEKPVVLATPPSGNFVGRPPVKFSHQLQKSGKRNKQGGTPVNINWVGVDE